MLNHLVVLYNYIGEIDDQATYQATVIAPCCCPTVNGSSQGTEGNSATLYVFDTKSIAKSPEGAQRSYLPYDKWVRIPTADKGKYWTLSDRGTDYFQKGNSCPDVRQEIADKFKITGFRRFDTGSKRMWHWEVTGG